MTASTWKDALADTMPAEWAREIDMFESQMALRQQGTIDEVVFAETRLRRGVYGQRYDNGQRHDGTESRTLAFPAGVNTKGHETVWDAPGMQRIKLPFGGLSAEQLECMADLAEEYSDAILHVTTRQDIQLHYVHIDDTPDMMRRLTTVGITTREACGNSVRNVTACPVAGVCRTEPFDVTPYAHALTFFLLGHPDVQDFGRKFKVAFSGCAQNACALTSLHDLGFIARTRTGPDGAEQRGFEMVVGGGLGAVPHQARLLTDFATEAEILPLSQAVCRVFARLGEKRNRARARIKFLVQKMGIEDFKAEVFKELETIPHDPRWTAYLSDLGVTDETPAHDPLPLQDGPRPAGYDAWAATNAYVQRQDGYATATISLPLGDITSVQSRALADLARKYSGGHMRTTVEQNIVLRWVPAARMPELFEDLRDAGLAEGGAGTIVDITACPGTDTCKLGISSSRGLAAELRTRLGEQALQMDRAVRDLRIKISGCFNACGQHHVSDIGFYGVSRKVGGHAVPHFQVVLGGAWDRNADSYGLATVAIPSMQIPEVVTRLTGTYLREREGDERFTDYVKRVGKVKLKKLLDDLKAVPAYEEDRSFYSDWNDPREYTLGDMGVGECAGEVVPLVQFGLAAAEALVFEAQVALDAGQPAAAAEKAYGSMLKAAKALVSGQFIDITDDPEHIVKEFTTRFYDTKIFFDPFAKGKFASYLYRVHGEGFDVDADEAHRRIEEAQLFIEATHACDHRMSQQAQAGLAV